VLKFEDSNGLSSLSPTQIALEDEVVDERLRLIQNLLEVVLALVGSGCRA